MTKDKKQEMPEVWLQVPRYEDKYLVSDFGRIISLPRGRGTKKDAAFLKFSKSHSGYFRVALCENSIAKGMFVHRIVAMTFIKNESRLKTVNHKNGIKTDNRVTNLEWMSVKDNLNHGWDCKLRTDYGENSHMAKLKRTDIKEIFRLRKINKLTYQSIAERFGVTPGNIGYILRGQSWTRYDK